MACSLLYSLHAQGSWDRRWSKEVCMLERVTDGLSAICQTCKRWYGRRLDGMTSPNLRVKGHGLRLQRTLLGTYGRPQLAHPCLCNDLLCRSGSWDEHQQWHECQHSMAESSWHPHRQ